MSLLVVSTYTGIWRTELGSLLTQLDRAGYRHVELLAANPHIDLDDPSAAAGAIAGMKPASISINSVVPSGVDVNLASTQAQIREWSITQFINAVRVAASVGAPYAIVHPGRRHPLRPPPLPQQRDWVLAGLSEIVDFAERQGVRVLLENVPTGIIDTAAECAETARHFDGRLRLCYDIANGHMVEDVCQALETASPWLELVHLSDTTRDHWRHDPLGQGDVPLNAVVHTLRRLPFEGPVVLETLHEQPAEEGFAADERHLVGLELTRA